ncbi:MAG TPA: DUF4188 domain-containing protein [Acidimicrobiia bacterium]|nr:DUF4188 domain-containing protein [Acidimicrobiia bacterium]
MRTRDFSMAPIYAHGEAMFVGATKYRSPLSWLRLTRYWRAMVKDLKNQEGYCWHRVYYFPPFTLGTIAAFTSKDSLLHFARSKSHHNLIHWLISHKSVANAGFIRLYFAEESGYTNGIWRAEDQAYSHIKNFTPIENETSGPAV